MSDQSHLSSVPHEGEGPSADPDGKALLKTVPRFSARRLHWQVRLDWALRLGTAVAVVIVLLAVSAQAGGSWLAVTLAVVLALGAWMLINGISSRTSAALSRLTAMVEDDPAEAEAHLAWHLRRRPLLKWVRLLLYQRLAILRHQQRRYDEAAAICEQVLSYRLGPAEGVREHLLLLLAEARIDRGDARGAYPAIATLYPMTLPMIESMHRLTLQTRYELLAGYPERALWQHGHKLRLAELMPAGPAGALHAMLATAADRCGQGQLATWLWQRVELLATDEQRELFGRGRFDGQVYAAAEARDEADATL
jgi:hypothetical protein